MSHLKLVFFGTSDFAVHSLRALAQDDRFEILSIITQPDRAVGRHAVLTPPAVKQAAVELGLPVLQFEKVRTPEAVEAIKQLQADMAVVISFGQLIPQTLLDAFPLGAVNVHGSILPSYRGASPIQAAIRNGDQETGVSIMLLDALMDHGPVLAIAKEPILPTDTAASLHDRLAELGASVLPQVLIDYAAKKIKPVEQDHAQASNVKLLAREDGLIDPTKQTATEAERMIRAYTPWPGTFIPFQDQRLKIKQAKIGTRQSAAPGTPTITSDGYPALICQDGVELILTSVQPEGKRAMDGQEFLRGNRWA